MSGRKFRISRRHFLGTSFAVGLGGVSTGLMGKSVEANQRPVPAIALEGLRPSGMVDEAY